MYLAFPYNMVKYSLNDTCYYCNCLLFLILDMFLCFEVGKLETLF